MLLKDNTVGSLPLTSDSSCHLRGVDDGIFGATILEVWPFDHWSLDQETRWCSESEYFLYTARMKSIGVSECRIYPTPICLRPLVKPKEH